MLAPGMTITNGQVSVTAGAATEPDFFNQGVGFMSDGSLAINTDPPSGDIYRNGIRQSTAGAFYGTTSEDPSDEFVGGLRISAAGQLVYEAAAAASYINGNPLTANGRFATT